MKNRVFSLIIVLLTTAFLISCKKEKEEEPLSRKQILTAHAWKLGKVLFNGLEITDPTALAAIGAFSNNSFLFKSDGTYTATDNTTGAVTTGTWELQENDSKLLIKSSSESYTFTVANLTQDILSLTTPFTAGPPLIPLQISGTAEIQLIPVK